MKALYSAVAFQVVWLVSVLGGNGWALLSTGLYLLLHWRYFMETSREWRLIGVFLLAGLIIDGVLIGQGVIRLDPDWVSSTWLLPPLWLLCLWVAVGTLFSHALYWARQQPWLFAGAAFVGPPLSYLGGARLTGADLAEPLWFSLLLLGVVWMLVLLGGNYLAAKWLDRSLVQAK